MGPGAHARVAEIMSGRAIMQQGLTTTCKDRGHDGTTGGPGRMVVWRMSPYERRRRGNALPGDPRGRPGKGLDQPGKGALGTRWSRVASTHPDTELDRALEVPRLGHW